MPEIVSAADPSSARLPFFDMLRGFAAVLMAIFHFCFDLNNFSVLHQHFNSDPFWLDFRAVIMTLFTGLTGVGFYLGGASWHKRSYWRRAGQLAACAALVTVATWFMFPQSYVFFGVLHYFLVATLLAPALIRWPKLCLLLGVVLIALPEIYQDMWFHQPGWIITGLSPQKPITEDFSPFAPWLGVTMVGVFIGSVARKKPLDLFRRQWSPLAKLGQHTLLFYMLHQLVLFPLAMGISKIVNSAF